MIRIKLPFQIKVYFLLFLPFVLLVPLTTSQVNSLVSDRIIQDHTQKFEELKSTFYNLLGFKIQSIENETFLLADQDELRQALDRYNEYPHEKPTIVQKLPGSQRRELIIVTDRTGRVIDGSIILRHAEQLEIIDDPQRIQTILDSWGQNDYVLMGYDSIGYVVIPTGKRNTLFAVASTPVVSSEVDQNVLGSISVGFPVDQSLANDLRRGSRFHIGFILDNRIVASTFDGNRAIDFSTAWDEMPRDKRERLTHKAEELTLFNEQYLAYAAPLPTQGTTRALYIILSPLQETFILLDRLNKTILAVSLFILVIVLWIAYLLARSVTAPVSALARTVSQIAGGDYGIRVSIRTGDELEILGNEIHEMAATIRRRNEEIQDYIKQIEEWNRELENKVTERTQDLEEKNFRLRMISEELGRAYARIDDELKIVGELQKRLLPTRSFERKGLTFRSVYIPNGRAGGDYYDYLSPAGNQLYILIADVSGHGTPAAFIMGITRAMSHTLIEQQLSPQALLKKLSTVLLKTLRTGEFITMFLGCLDMDTFQFQYACAGHQPPLLLRKRNGALEELKVERGLPLGIIEDAEYDQETTAIEPGDRLLMYTDGIVEAFNDEKKPYGIERLEKIIRNSGSTSADDLLETILDDLEQFVQHPLDIEPLEDDVTLLLIDFSSSKNIKSNP